MLSIMSHCPPVLWTKKQLTDHLAYTTRLFRDPVFHQTHALTAQGQTSWIHLIHAVGDLVRQAALAGKRIDFATQKPGPGKPQDITSLLDSMGQVAYVIPDLPRAQVRVTVIYPAFNSFYGRGEGNFANGHAFVCEHRFERAFFIGAQKIYLYRHLTRAFVEAKRYLKSLIY
jgi:hypothetical protein